MKRGPYSPRLKETEIEKIRELYALGAHYIELAELYQVSKRAMHRIVKGSPPPRVGHSDLLS